MAEGRSQGPIAAGVSIVRDIFSLLRDAAVFGSLVLLLAFPVFVNQALSEAGIVEVNSGLFVWKTQLAKTDDQLNAASQTITELRDNQNKLLGQLAQFESAAASPEQKQAIVEARAQVQSTQLRALQVQRAARETLRLNAPLVAKAR